jgi:NADH-quinone oxidoreductase subunit J
MNILFYIAAGLAVLSTLRMIAGRNVIHSLLYLIVSLLAVSVILFLLGAPFIAALEVIIYAGAIMVLFVFVIMMLNVSRDGIREERSLLRPGIWTGPVLITVVLFIEMAYMLVWPPASPVTVPSPVPPRAVGALLYTKYSIVVELAAFLLAAGIIGAYHLGQKQKTVHHRYLKKEADLL